MLYHIVRNYSDALHYTRIEGSISYDGGLLTLFYKSHTSQMFRRQKGKKWHAVHCALEEQ
jgi:hypothetical protein